MRSHARVKPLSRRPSAEVLLVVNAHASGVRPELVAGVEAQLARWGAASRKLVTESSDEWIDAVAGEPNRRLVLVGGDGTLHAAANAPPPRAELALIPAGSANNVARSLGIPLEPHAAVRLAVEGSAKPIDLLEAVTPSRRYLTVEGLSAGFLSQARSRYHGANSANLGSAAVAAVVAVAEFHPFRVRMTREGTTEDLELIQLFVANLPLYGFGLHVSPGADPTDGLLDVVAIEGHGRPDLLPMVLRLRHASELERAEAHRWRVERTTIDTHGAVPIVADSSDLGSGRVHLSVLPRELSLVRP